MSLFSRINAKVKEAVVSSGSAIKRGTNGEARQNRKRKQWFSGRSLRLEPLEDRQLLSVTTVDYEEIELTIPVVMNTNIAAPVAASNVSIANDLSGTVAASAAPNTTSTSSTAVATPNEYYADGTITRNKAQADYKSVLGDFDYELERAESEGDPKYKHYFTSTSDHMETAAEMLWVSGWAQAAGFADAESVLTHIKENFNEKNDGYPDEIVEWFITGDFSKIDARWSDPHDAWINKTNANGGGFFQEVNYDSIGGYYNAFDETASADGKDCGYMGQAFIALDAGTSVSAELQYVALDNAKVFKYGLGHTDQGYAGKGTFFPERDSLADKTSLVIKAVSIMPRTILGSTTDTKHYAAVMFANDDYNITSPNHDDTDKHEDHIEKDVWYLVEWNDSLDCYTFAVEPEWYKLQTADDKGASFNALLASDPLFKLFHQNGGTASLDAVGTYRYFIERSQFHAKNTTATPNRWGDEYIGGSPFGEGVSYGFNTTAGQVKPFIVNIAFTGLEFLANYSAKISPYALEDTYSLESYKGSQNTIYLDLTTIGLDSHSGSASFQERIMIQEIWQRVSEDFMPFNVNVTTNANVRGSGTYITLDVGTDLTRSYLDNANLNGFPPSASELAMSQNTTLAKLTAEGASAAIGGRLGLSADAYLLNEEAYPGRDKWGPIMGNPNSMAKQYTQWSRGEYASAEGAQDEVATIASRLGYRIDDFGNTINDAQSLSDFLVDVYWQYDPLISLYENYNEWKNQYAKVDKYSSSQGTYLVSGVIGRSEDENGNMIYDQDLFSFVSSGASYVIDVSSLGVDMRWNSASPAWANKDTDYYYGFDWWMTNLNVKVELLNSRGEIIQFYDPLTTSFTHFTTGNLAEGETFYIKVYGIGEGNALTNGFSDYGSMGSYTLSVTENLEDFVVRNAADGTPLDKKDPYYNAIVVTTLEDTVAMDGQISLREALSYIGRRLEDGSFIGTTVVFSDKLLSTDKTFYFGNDNEGEYRGELYLNYELSGKTTTIDAQYFYHFKDPNDGTDKSHRVLNGEGGVKLDAGTNITIDARLKLEDGTFQNASGRVLQVNNIAAEIRGLVITGGNATTATDFPDIQLQYGGGIFNNYGWLTIKDSIIAGNSALKAGGGIYNTGGYAPMYYPSESGNEYNFNDAFGSLTILNSEIIGNRTTYTGNVSSSSFGGGIFNYFTGELFMYNSTVAGNLSIWSGGGLENNGRAYIYNSIFANNYADRGVDIYTEKDAFNNQGGTEVYYSLIRDASIDNDSNTYNYGATKGKGILKRTGTIAGTRTVPRETGFLSYKDYAVYKVNTDYLGYGIVSMVLDPDNIPWTADLWKDWNLSLSASSAAIDLGNQAYYTESDYIVEKWTNYWNINTQKQRENSYSNQFTNDWNDNWETNYGNEFNDALDTLLAVDPVSYYDALDAVDAAILGLDLDGYETLATFLPTLGDNGLISLNNNITVDISTPVKFCLAINNVDYNAELLDLVYDELADAITAKIQTGINNFLATDKTTNLNGYNDALTKLDNLFKMYVWNDATGAYYQTFSEFLARQGNYTASGTLVTGSLRFRNKTDLTKYVTYDIKNAGVFYDARRTAGNSAYFNDIDLCILTGFPQDGTIQDRENINNARSGIMDSDGTLWYGLETALTDFQGENTYAAPLNDLDNLYVRMFGYGSGFGKFLVANSPLNDIVFDDPATAPRVFSENCDTPENTAALSAALDAAIRANSITSKFFTNLRDVYVTEKVETDRQTEVAALIIEHEAKYDLGRKTRIVGNNIDAGAFEYQGMTDPLQSQSDFSEFAPKTTNTDAEYNWNSSAIASKTQGDRIGFGVSGTETTDGDNVRKDFVLEPDTTSNVITKDESVYLNFAFTNLDGATVGQKVLDDALTQLLAATTTDTVDYDNAIGNCDTQFEDLFNGISFEEYLAKIKTLGNIDVSDPGKLHAAYKAGLVTQELLVGQIFADGIELFGTLLNNWLYSVSVDAATELGELETIYEAWLGTDNDFTQFLTTVGTNENGIIKINDTLNADISTPDKFRTLVLDWSTRANSDDETIAETWTGNLATLMNEYNAALTKEINDVEVTYTTIPFAPVGWKAKLGYCFLNDTGLMTPGFFLTDATWAVATEKMDTLYTAWFGEDLDTFLDGRTLTGGTAIGNSVELYNALKGNDDRIDEYNDIVSTEITNDGTLPFNTYANFTRSTVTVENLVETKALFTIMISPSYADPTSDSELTILYSDTTIFHGDLLIDSANGSVTIGSSASLTVNGEVVGKINYAENGLVTIEDLNLGTLDRGAYLFMMELNPNSDSPYLPTGTPAYTRINETSLANNKSYVKIQVAEQLTSDPIVVTTASDEINPFDGETSLREAIRAAGSKFTKEYEITSGNYIQMAGTDGAQGPIYYVEGDKVYNVEKGDFLNSVENNEPTDMVSKIEDGTTLFLYEDTVVLLQIEGASPAEARYSAGTVFVYNADQGVFTMENGSHYRFMEGTKLVLNSVHIGEDFWFTWSGERKTKVVIPEDSSISSTFDLLENLSGYNKAGTPVTFTQSTSGYYIRTGTMGSYVYHDLAVGDQITVTTGTTVFKLNENSVRVSEVLTANLDLTWQNGYWKSATNDLYALKKGTELTYETANGSYEIVKAESISPENGDVLVSADQQTIYAYYDATNNKFYTDQIERTTEYEYTPNKSVTYSIRRTEYPSSPDQILTYKNRNVLKQTDTLGSLILFDADVFKQAGIEITLIKDNGTILVDKSITIDASQFVEWDTTENKWIEVSADQKVVVSGNDEIQIFTFGSSLNTNIDITIKNMTLQNGLAEFVKAENGIDILGGGNGGAIENYGNLTLDDCDIQDNTARQYGAGIYSVGSLNISNSNVSGNKIDVAYEKYNTYPEAYGAGVYSQSDQNLILDNVSFENNSIVLDYQNVNINVKAGGAGLYSIGSTIITGSADELDPTAVSGNTVRVNPIDPDVDASGTLTGYGAGLAVVGDLELSNIEFENNTLTKGTGIVNTLYGGAVYVSGDAVITDVDVTNNSAMIGGGIAAENGTLDLSVSNITNNTGERKGAGLYTTSMTLIDQSEISENELEIVCPATEESNWIRSIGGAGIWSAVNNVSGLDPNYSAVLKIYDSKIEDNKISFTIEEDFEYGIDLTVRGGGIYVENGLEIGGALGTSVSGNEIDIQLGAFDRDSIIGIKTAGAGIYNAYTLDPSNAGSASVNTVISGSNILENSVKIQSNNDLNLFNTATEVLISNEGAGLYRSGLLGTTNLYIDNSLISGNSALFTKTGSGTSTIIGRGGAAYLLNETAYFANSVFGMNAADQGAAFYNHSGSLALYNSTVGVNGVGTEEGGSIYNTGNLALFNSIVAQTRDASDWENTLGTQKLDIFNESGSVAVSASMIGWAEETENWTIEGTCFIGSDVNIIDPFFKVDLAQTFQTVKSSVLTENGLQLTSSSYGIDVGINENAIQMTSNGPVLLEYDILGNDRIYNGSTIEGQSYVPTVDFGAYEFTSIVYSDLAFTTGSVTIGPAVPSTANEVTVSFTGINHGPGIIFRSFDYEIHLSKKNDQDEYVEINVGQYIKTKELSSSDFLAKSDTFSVSDYSLGFLGKGDYRIQIYLDKNNTVLESDKDNNWSYYPNGETEGVFFSVGLSNQFVVNTNMDITDPDDGMISLREAITSATTEEISGGTAYITFSSDMKGKTIYLENGQIEIPYNNTTFDGNHLTTINIDASSIGGLTIDAQNTGRIFSISNDITDPAITQTGGVFLKGLTLQNGNALEMDASHSPMQGGAINNAYKLTVEDCTFTKNTAKDGSAIRNVGDLVVRNSVIVENTATGNGAIFNGGTDNIGNVTIIGSLIAGNDSGTGYGGAVSHQGSSLIIRDSDLSGNSAGFGGGIALVNTGVIEIENCTIVGNIAKGTVNENGAVVLPGQGGGIYTIVDFKLTDSIVAGNKAALDPEYFAKSGKWTPVNNVNNLIGADTSELFTSFASYTKWSKDLYKSWNLQLLETADAAIDKGTTTRSTDAQDAAGNPRIVNTIIDIGAYEYQAGNINIITPQDGENISVGSTDNKIAADTEITTIEFRSERRGIPVSYSIKADENADPLAEPLWKIDSATGLLTAAKEIADGTYDITILANVDGVENPYESNFTITIAPQLGSSKIVDTHLVTSTSVSLTWNTVENAVKYQIRYKKLGEDENAWTIYQNGIGQSYFYATSALVNARFEIGSTYIFQIRALSNEGYIASDWSDQQREIVASASLIPGAKEIDPKLLCWSSKQMVTIEYVLPSLSVKSYEFAEGQILKLVFNVGMNSQGRISKWILNWGDGSGNKEISALGTNLNAAHYYEANGNYSITLKLIDSEGYGASFSYSLGKHVVDSYPVPSAIPVSQTIVSAVASSLPAQDTTTSEIASPMQTAGSNYVQENALFFEDLFGLRETNKESNETADLPIAASILPSFTSERLSNRILRQHINQSIDSIYAEEDLDLIGDYGFEENLVPENENKESSIYDELLTELE